MAPYQWVALAAVAWFAPLVSATDVAEEKTYDQPNRVFVWVIGVLPIVYGVIMLFFVGLIKALRAGPAKGYAEMKEKGTIRTEDLEHEDGEGNTEEVAEHWLTAGLDQVRVENGLDAALYLQHNQHMSMYCLAQFLVMGIPLCLTYSLGGGYESGLSMFAWSYANLSSDSATRFVPVLAAYWVVFSSAALVYWKQTGMERFKLDSQSGNEGSASANAVWLQGLPESSKQDDIRKILEEDFTDIFSCAEALKVKEVQIVWDVNELGHNIRQQRKLINTINKMQDTTE